MNKKVSFILGFVFALLISSVGLYIFVQEAKSHSNSLFIAGYTQEVSTLTFILDESNPEKREEIARAELCEAIDLIQGKIEKSVFSVNYVEVVVAKSVSDYKSYISSLDAKYCAKNI